MLQNRLFEFTTKPIEAGKYIHRLLYCHDDERSVLIDQKKNVIDGYDTEIRTLYRDCCMVIIVLSKAKGNYSALAKH